MVERKHSEPPPREKIIFTPERINPVIEGGSIIKISCPRKVHDLVRFFSEDIQTPFTFETLRNLNTIAFKNDITIVTEADGFVLALVGDAGSYPAQVAESVTLSLAPVDPEMFEVLLGEPVPTIPNPQGYGYQLR
ncbi:MAG: hypothetical protein RLZZ455_30 [Candidatus Parcubacteria bacterium]|jgi:hypothetical protein